MDHRVCEFIENATIARLKSALYKLKMKTSGNKAELKVRFENGIKEKNQDEILEIISAVHDDDGDYNDTEDNGGVPVPANGSMAAHMNNENEGHVNEYSDSLNEQIEELEQIVEKRQKILELRKKLIEISENDNILNFHAPTTTFRDVDESLYKFSGDDNFSVQKWLQHFEESSEMYGWNDKVMFIYAQKLMVGTAKMFLRATRVKTWSELKQALLKEFKTSSSKAEIHNMLRKRRKKSEETCQQYILTMQEIGSLADIDESDIVQYIIDGIPDAPGNKVLLYAATNLGDLKNLLRRYEIMKSRMINRQLPHVPKANGHSNFDKTRQWQKQTSTVKCYNCNETGHISKLCTKPKRGQGACFQCGLSGHTFRECRSKPSTVNNLLPSTSKQEQVKLNGEGNDFELPLEFTFFSGLKQNHPVTLHTLIDSGSPISFTQERFVASHNYERLKTNDHRYFGINGSPLEVIGIINCNIKFKDDFIDFCLYVVKNFSMVYNVILGRDFLKINNMNIIKIDDKQETLSSCSNHVLMNENRTKSENESIIDDDVSSIMNINITDNKTDCSPSININQNLPVQIKCQIHDVITETISNNNNNNACLHLKNNNNVKLSIRLTKHEPFYCTPRRLAYSHKVELKKILDDLLKRNIIRESNSPYASPIVLTQKKNKEFRLCIDYRELNKYTVKDNYPLPLIDDLLDGLRDKKYFTILDLKNGFHHVDVAEDSIQYTSFVTPLGQYEYTKMPFGLRNAPNVFQRFINKIFQELINENKLKIYMDDILIATEGIDEHLNILKSVLMMMKRNKLELRLDKCKFLQEEITYLGYVVNADGIRPNPENLKAICNYPVPQNVKNVQSFVGLCSYFRRFIKDFATIAKPLHDLIKKDVPFRFGPEELKSFEVLKRKLLQAPILSVYSPLNETELHCDASGIGFGAVLMQKQKDNQFHPIFYFSKRCTDAESRYHSYELETLSIIYALRRFRIYLLGLEFKIVTDCKSLTLTLNKKLLNARISRWALEMQEFNYKIEHRVSSRMQHVDFLSRCANILSISDESFEYALACAQKRDSTIIELSFQLEKRESKEFTLINGLVYRKIGDAVRFYVPKHMETQVIQTHHDGLCHLGTDKCHEYLKKTYWFPDMKQKIRAYIKNCLKCIHFSVPSGKTEGFLHNIPKGKIPFECLHIDHLGPLPNTQAKKKHILVIIDSFTKFVKLFAVSSTQSVEAIKWLESYFQTYSRPTKIISDRGSCFTSAEFTDFLKDNNIQHVKIATMSPQSNGQVERINRLIIPMISKSCESHTTGNWHKFLVKVEFALNNSVNRSTGQTPSILLFGVRQKGEVCDRLKEALEDKHTESCDRNLNEVRKEASRRIEKNQKYNKSYYDRRHKEPFKYSLGDYVMLRNVSTTPGVNKKLLPKYKGPYEVIKILDNDRYIVQDIEGLQVSRVPYKGVCTPANMKLYMNSIN